MNQEAQPNMRLMEAGVEGRPAKCTGLWWVLCTLEKQIKALPKAQNSVRGANVLP